MIDMVTTREDVGIEAVGERKIDDGTLEREQPYSSSPPFSSTDSSVHLSSQPIPASNALRRKVAHAVDPALVERNISTASAMAKQPYSIDPACSNASTNSSWHDERLQKTIQRSDTFQKRLEEQAAQSIRKTEERAQHTYEKKIQNCINTLEVVGKRKKNDLRLIELRKKSEMEKFKKRFYKEMFEKEMQNLKGQQDVLKKQVLDMKAQNTALRESCRKLAIQNKQLIADKETAREVQKEVAHHGEIRAQLEEINRIFRESHEAAIADMKRLESDCSNEATERKKLQSWIASLVRLMEERCCQPKLLEKIQKIEARAKKQRDRDDRTNSSQRSTRSGTTVILNKKVENMRKMSGKQRILKDRTRLSASSSGQMGETRVTRTKRRETVDAIAEINESDSNSMIVEEDEDEEDEDGEDEDKATDKKICRS